MATRACGVGATVRVVHSGRTVSAHIDVQPAQRYRIEVHHHDGPRLVTSTDVCGQAHVTGIPRGLVSIYLMPHGGNNDVRRTAWVTL